MKITKLLKEDNRLSLYLNNLDDLQVVFESISQEAVEFFDDCFYYTFHCNQVKNLDLKQGQPFFVSSMNSSIID